MFPLQIVLGQEDPEQDLQALIVAANQEFAEYVDPIIARLEAFGSSFVPDIETLQTEYVDIRTNLTNLANEYGANTSDCYYLAVQNAYFYYLQSRKYNIITCTPNNRKRTGL